jgi:hypothetical protein
MSVKTRAAITADITADYLTGSAGNISAADIRKGLDNINESKANVIKAGLDCSTNPNYPASERGDTIPVSTAGRIGGSAGLQVKAGDMIVCLTDSATGTQSAVGANFAIVTGVFSSERTVLITGVDATSTGETNVPLPAGYTFFPDTIEVCVTAADTVTGQPTLEFGNSNDTDALKTAAATTNLTAAGHRNRYTSLATNTGQDDSYGLSVNVTSAATATTMTLTIVFVGFFLKD